MLISNHKGSNEREKNKETNWWVDVMVNVHVTIWEISRLLSQGNKLCYLEMTKYFTCYFKLTASN